MREPLGLETLRQNDRSSVCPSCGAKGRRVASPALKGVLTNEAMRRLESVSYFFCRTPACSTIYFSASPSIFDRTDLRVPVWEKEPPGTRTICYCFGENESVIRDEIARSGSSTAAERIRTHIRANRCACEWRNPRGECCLGDVLMIIGRELRSRRGG